MGILRPRPLLLFHVFFYLQIIFSYFLELYIEKFCIRFCLKTEFIFNGWSTVQTYPMKTVTVYAFKNASLNEFFLNAVFRYSCWVKKREVFENVYVTVLDTSKRACSQQRCYPFSVTIAFSCGRAETIENCKTWTGPKNTDT